MPVETIQKCFVVHLMYSKNAFCGIALTCLKEAGTIVPYSPGQSTVGGWIGKENVSDNDRRRPNCGVSGNEIWIDVP